MNEHDDLIEDLEATDADGVVGGAPTHHLRTVEQAKDAAVMSARTRDASPLATFAKDQVQQVDPT